MANTSVATAADYADAMLTARRFRNVLFWVLMLILLGQLAVFFTAKFTDVLDKQVEPPASAAVGEVATTQVTVAESAATTQGASSESQSLGKNKPLTKQLLQYLIGMTDFFGIVLTILYSLVLLLLVNIMLVGRLIGISYVTRAFIWSLLLALLV